MTTSDVSQNHFALVTLDFLFTDNQILSLDGVGSAQSGVLDRTVQTPCSVLP